MKKSVLFLVLYGLLLAPYVAYAESCGENCTYEIGNNGDITISGTGELTKDMVGAIAEIAGHSVTVSGFSIIGDSAFQGSQLTGVKIGDSVMRIEDFAFYGENTLQNVDLGNSVTYVGDMSFAHTSLTDIFIPESVELIQDYAFYETPLEQITLFDGTGIGQEIFWDNNDVVIYCIGDEDVCRENINSPWNRYFYDGQVVATEVSHKNGVIYVYDEDGNLISQYGKETKQAKRIYTVEEAAKLSKDTGNTIKLRYK